MSLRFVAQPFDGNENLIDFVEFATAGGFSRIQIAVAWAKRSGLGRIRESLEAFKASGGTIEMIVGVSEGGATQEGLRLALELSDESFVFHDPRRTFHPKVYLATGENLQSLFVGSSNMTAGGLAWNYEASLWANWDEPKANSTVEDVQQWFEVLRREQGACQPLTVELIQQMADSNDLWIGSESTARRVSRKQVESPEDNDSTETGSAQGIFTRVVAKLRKLPPLAKKSQGVPQAKPVEVKSLSKNGSPERGIDPALVLSDTVTRRWYRQLDHSQAQQKKTENTKLTGCLKLGQAGSNFDHKTYFYKSFFSALPWSPVPNKEEQLEVEVGFNCWIDGHDLGVHFLRISHDPRRIAGQANVPTWLHWGTLGPYLKETNYIGFYVTLERLVGNKFNLIISRGGRGDYLA